MSDRTRPDLLESRTKKIETACGQTLYATIGVDGDRGQLYEVILVFGKAGGCVSANGEVVGRLLTKSLHHGVPVEQMTKQLVGVTCYQGSSGVESASCWDAVGQFLNEEAERVKHEITDQVGTVSANVAGGKDSQRDYPQESAAG